MTRDQAERRLRKLFGPRGYYRVADECSSVEKRAAATESMRADRARRDAIDLEIKERLAACDWYQALLQERLAVVARLGVTAHESHAYKFAVGHLDNIIGAFHIKGEGDTWEEAFEKAEAKK